VNSRYLNVLRISNLLVSDVSSHRRFRNRTDAANIVASTPESGHARLEPRKFLSQFVRSKSLKLCRNMCGSQSRVRLYEYVNVVGHDFQSVNLGLQVFRLLVQQLPKSLLNLSNQNFQSILGAPNQVIFERVRRSCTDSISGVNHNVSVTPR
jgi:hypothetical protein